VGLARIWFSKQNEQYYPITFTAFWLEYRIFGDQPRGYHSINILLHGINAAFVYLVLRRLSC